MAGKRSLIKTALFATLAVAAIGGIVWAVVHPRPDQAQFSRRGPGQGPVPVAVTQVHKSDLPLSLRALGTVTSLSSVTVRTQIAGQLQQVAFTEGQLVNKGDFLAQIDPRPYQAQLEQYSGQLARDQALLHAAELDLGRYRQLVSEDSIARQQLDNQASLVAQYKGAIETDKAQIATARLNIAYCHIVAPQSGRVGLRQVDPGNYVQTSDTNGIVVITQLQPINVVFSLPEDNVPALIKRLHSGDTLPVVAYDRAGTQVLANGKLLTVDNQIDTATGTVKLKAQFDNKDESLFPNQFVNTVLQLDTLRDRLNIPSSAVLKGAPGTFVYVVKDDQTVEVRPVELGNASGDLQIIAKGLNEGETVVIDGMDKLRDGAKVVATDRSAPNNPNGGAPPPERKRKKDREEKAQP